MKKLLILLIAGVTAASLFLISSPAESRLASYYSGDAIAYKNQVYVATTNTGSLEIFKLSGADLVSIVDQSVYRPTFNTYDDFFDVKFNEESGRLYVYAVSHYTVFKYELSGDKLSLVNESKNTYWEWYNRVDIFGDDLVIISAKGIKIINKDLEFINSYDFNNLAAPYNLSSDNSRFFLSMSEASGSLEIYDRETNKIIKQIPLNFKHKQGNRRAYQDAAGYVYAVDDIYAKKFDVAGNLLGSFKHLDYQGFDIKASAYTNDVYFSNGVGVVKLNKDMELKDYAWATNLGGQGSWSMGLKLVYNNGDKIIIFNNSNIVVLNDKLDTIASVNAQKTAREYPSENLFLNVDKYRATVNADLALSGGGFLPKEDLVISFADKKLNVKATTDHRGRFSVVIKVPESKLGSQDIKVSGVKSQLHYSTSFLVE